MADELAELLDTAIYKEIASQAFYLAGQNKTEDLGAQELMRELAQEELKHAQLLKDFKDQGIPKQDWHQEKIPNLMISEYLTSPDTVEGAGLQETLIFAMKREQEAIEFYSRMMAILRSEPAKRFCENIVSEELKHKLRLEIMYDDLFYGLYEVKQWEQM